MKVKDIAEAIEAFAPLSLQEDYDNSGLQVGSEDMEVSGVLLCLDVTERVLDEARSRGCNMVVSHHPLIFRGLKSLTGRTPVEQLAISALRNGIAVYSAHTNLDSACGGVSYEMAHILKMTSLQPLSPTAPGAATGLGVIGDIEPTPTLELLRRVKDKFHVKALRYSRQSSKLVIKRIALCGGSGAEFIADAVRAGADIMITADIKYHEYGTWEQQIVLADIGHYESERCAERILSRIIRDKFADAPVYFSDTEQNPVATLINNQ